MSHLQVSVALKSFFSQPLQNFAAGATVAIVALPLALAFGIGSGLGAAAGLTTAIIAGLVAAIFGGSKYQVSGPTGAMTVVLIPIFSQYGAPGVLGVGLIAGGLLILSAIFRIGQHVHKLPTALIEGFTAGIAIVIAISQLQFLIDFNSSISALVIAVAVVLASRKIPRLPISLISVIVAAVLNSALNLELTSIGELPARFFNRFLKPGLHQISVCRYRRCDSRSPREPALGENCGPDGACTSIESCREKHRIYFA